MEFFRRLTITQAVILLAVVLILLVAMLVVTNRPISDEERFATPTPSISDRGFAPTFTPTPPGE